MLTALMLTCIGCSNRPNCKSEKSIIKDFIDYRISNAKSDTTNKNILTLNEELIPFKCVVDTLNSKNDKNIYSEYFMFDITGDSVPELWVVSGSCDADKELWVYRSCGDRVEKIFSGNGGHTEFFVKGSNIGSLTCNTGTGYVSAYTFDGSKILMESIEYDGNVSEDEDLVEVKSKRDREIADIWEHSDSIIYLKEIL